MKIAAGVVVLGLLLAGCGSGGQAQAPTTPATGGVVPYTDDSTPASIASPTITANATDDVAAACKGLMIIVATEPFKYTQLDSIYQGLALAQGSPLNDNDVVLWGNALNTATPLAQSNSRMSTALSGLSTALENARVQLATSSDLVRSYWLTVKQECAAAGVPSPT